MLELSRKTNGQEKSYKTGNRRYVQYWEFHSSFVTWARKLLGKMLQKNLSREKSKNIVKLRFCEANRKRHVDSRCVCTNESVVAILEIMHQEQEWNGKTVLRPIAFGSKVLNVVEMTHGAPKAQISAVVTFVEKYRAYLSSDPLKLLLDNKAVSWLKTYSMDQSYIGRWILLLDGYNLIIKLRTRDNHQNADNLSKNNLFYERQEQREADRPEIKRWIFNG